MPWHSSIAAGTSQGTTSNWRRCRGTENKATGCLVLFKKKTSPGDSTFREVAYRSKQEDKGGLHIERMFMEKLGRRSAGSISEGSRVGIVTELGKINNKDNKSRIEEHKFLMRNDSMSKAHKAPDLQFLTPHKEASSPSWSQMLFDGKDLACKKDKGEDRRRPRGWKTLQQGVEFYQAALEAVVLKGDRDNFQGILPSISASL
eukprot:Gb_39119 [translate_table: standard]